jgi:hypothetical protein
MIPKFTCALCDAQRPTTERHRDECYGDVCDACHDLVTWSDCQSVDPLLYERGVVSRPMNRDEQIIYRNLGGVERP